MTDDDTLAPPTAGTPPPPAPPLVDTLALATTLAHQDDDDEDDGTGPAYAREGSPQRMQVLLHLAQHPRGASIADLAALTGLAPDETQRLLRNLRNAQRVDCERRGPKSLWFSPWARATLEPRRTTAVTGARA